MNMEEQYVIDEFNNNEKLIHYILYHKLFITKHYKYNIYDYNDIYSIGKLGLIIAIKSYNKEKGAKSTYYCKCIYHEICSNNKLLNRDKRKLNFNSLSLDAPLDIHDDTENTLSDIISNDIEIYNKINKQLDINELIARANLTFEEMFILEKIQDGYTQANIGNIFNWTIFDHSCPYTHQNIEKIRNKIKNAFYEDKRISTIIKKNKTNLILDEKKKEKKFYLYDEGINEVYLYETIRKINVLAFPDFTRTRLNNAAKTQSRLLQRYRLLESKEELDRLIKNRQREIDEIKNRANSQDFLGG